jgi:glycine cleavage system regulatory protein
MKTTLVLTLIGRDQPGLVRTVAAAICALASVPCVWLQAHAHDLCDAIRDAGSR